MFAFIDVVGRRLLVLFAAGALIAGMLGLVAAPAAHAAEAVASGTVTDDNGQPVAEVSVYFEQRVEDDGDVWWDTDYEHVGESAANGTWSVAGLDPGAYRVRFAAPWDDDSDLVSVYYGGAYAAEDAQTVEITAAGPNALNQALPVGARIAGRVTDAAGDPLEGVWVSAEWLQSGELYSEDTETAPDGSYTVRRLPAGTFTVGFSAPGNHLPEYYDNAASADEAERITLVLGQERAGVDAELATGGTITGTITDEGGQPIADAAAEARTADGDWVGSAGYADEDGHYTIEQLPAGSYLVEFTSPWDYETGQSGNYLDEFYDDAQSLEEATPVAVAEGGTKAGIDAELATGGSVSGTMTNEDGDPLRGYVTAYANDQVWEAATTADGAYRINGLKTGDYKIRFQPNDAQYVAEFYDNALTLADATPVQVTAGADLPGIDAEIAVGGAIEGTLTPGEGVSTRQGQNFGVEAVDVATGTVVGSASAEVPGHGGDGTYRIDGLPTGTYRVQFARASGYADAAAQFYNGKTESAGPSAADPVEVAAGATRESIDATLLAGSSLTGKVVDAEGNGLADCLVHAYTPDGHLTTRADRAAPDGSFEIQGLNAGQYQVAALCDPGTGYYDGTGDLADQRVSASEVTTAASGTQALGTLRLGAGGETSVITNVTPPSTGAADPEVGDLLQATPGTWSVTPDEFTYRWLADGEPIDGATDADYTVTSGEIGKSLSVEVTPVKDGYAATAAVSPATAEVPDPADGGGDQPSEKCIAAQQNVDRAKTTADTAAAQAANAGQALAVAAAPAKVRKLIKAQAKVDKQRAKVETATGKKKQKVKKKLKKAKKKFKKAKKKAKGAGRTYLEAVTTNAAAESTKIQADVALAQAQSAAGQACS